VIAQQGNPADVFQAPLIFVLSSQSKEGFPLQYRFLTIFFFSALFPTSRFVAK